MISINTNKNDLNLPFGDFIEFLRNQGFKVTIDQYFRLQTVIKMFGKERTPLDLKYLICPIFAVNRIQQNNFYIVYDSFFKLLKDLPEMNELSNPLSDSIKSGSLIETYNADTKPTHQEDSKNNNNKKLTRLTYYLLFFLTLITALVTGLWLYSLSENHIKSNTIINSNSESIFITLINNYSEIIRIMIFFVFVIISFRELYRYKKKKLILQKQSLKSPPFTWPIQVPHQYPIFFKTELFHNLSCFFKKRTISDISLLDINKSIDQTIKKAGFTDLHYKTLTKQPEYLILINLPDYKDHYAHFINSITEELKSEGVYVSRFFYRDDPYICFNEIDSKREYLSDIAGLYRKHRLIIMGTGDYLLDPITGKLNESEFFEFWEERAILTPKEPKDWGERETAISKYFILLPASIEGFDSLVNYFESSPDYNFKECYLQENTYSLPDKLDDLDNIRVYLGDETFQWLCACAIYPELNWNLTLYIGNVVLENPMKENSLLRIIRLPWFKKGIIPKKNRLLLIEALDNKKEIEVRKAIIKLLENNPPPTTSFAFEKHRLNISIQKSMLPPKNRKKRKDIKNITIDENFIYKDYTLLCLLDSISDTPLNFLLPSRLKRFFFRNALPFLGLKDSIRIIFIVVATSFSVLITFFPDILIIIYIKFKEWLLIALGLTFILVFISIFKKNMNGYNDILTKIEIFQNKVRNNYFIKFFSSVNEIKSLRSKSLTFSNYSESILKVYKEIKHKLRVPFITAYKTYRNQIRTQRILENNEETCLFDSHEIQRSTHCYIEPNCTNVDPAREAEPRNLIIIRNSIFDTLDKYLSKEIPEQNAYHHILILADSGMGKTSFVLNYYARNKQKKRNQHKIYIVPLGKKSADEFIDKIQNKKDVVIILDALDEDQQAIKDYNKRIAELMEKCSNFKRVVITSRTQFFPSDEEIPKETGIAKVGAKHLGEEGAYTFLKLYLSPFSDEQVEAYLKKFYKWRFKERKKAFDLIKKIENLKVRPMLLSHIPYILDQTKGNEIKHSYELYDIMIEGWLDRESRFVKKDDLRNFSENLAVDIYNKRTQRGTERVNAEELKILAEKWKISLENWQLTGRSLLNRDAEGNYKFAHRSIMEYLYVKNYKYRHDIILTDQMKIFLREMVQAGVVNIKEIPNQLSIQ